MQAKAAKRKEAGKKNDENKVMMLFLNKFAAAASSAVVKTVVEELAKAMDEVCGELTSGKHHSQVHVHSKLPTPSLTLVVSFLLRPAH